MLKGDRQRMECTFSLLFSLPGSPMIVYGDEKGHVAPRGAHCSAITCATSDMRALNQAAMRPA